MAYIVGVIELFVSRVERNLNSSSNKSLKRIGNKRRCLPVMQAFARLESVRKHAQRNERSSHENH